MTDLSRKTEPKRDWRKIKYYPVSMEKLEQASMKEAAYLIAPMNIGEDYEYFDKVKHLLIIPEEPKTLEEIKQEIPYVNISTDNKFFIHQPKQSNWTCYLFGGNASFSSITWTPEEGKVPNAWVRFWMKVFLDCNWVKK